MGVGMVGRLMCTQRGSLLCVSEAYKAASVCNRTEGQGTVQIRGHRIILSVPLLCCCLCSLTLLVLRESSSPQCGDATSFSSHYVLIRGRYTEEEGIGPETVTKMHRASFRVQPVLKENA